ncbi:peptidoglycan-binding protein [Streptomyces sp. NPDC048275]|uniref:peptidoglycan-binding domain-containing protein n=1 Tax=Streptomyces sp. NPDC048275 TaxID=3155629 RepID=UPI0033E53EDC
MTESNGHVCPECAAPRTPDGTPSCACTQRASDALRDARTAEAAAAEDFDPLRIRPYVELGVGAGPRPDAEPQTTAEPTPDTWLETGGPAGGSEDSPEPGPARALGPEDEPPRRRRRTALLAVAVACVAAVAAAGLASGLFSYDTPARDSASPDDIRASVPEPSRTSTSASPTERASSTVSAPAPVVTPTKSSSPSPTRSRVSATPSRSATPSQTAPTAPTSSTATPSNSASDDEAAQILRPGDKGSEVTELQLRLRQLSLYVGTTDGSYSNQVEDAVRRYQWARGITADEQGVYGAATRASLEAETTEPQAVGRDAESRDSADRDQ